MHKPKLSLANIINMSIGFLGIQFGFSLQNSNASRILQIYGAEVEHLSLFWLAAPVAGMIVQPIIGMMSDGTWNRLGRRKPYFLTGAILASLGLILMPNSGIMVGVMSATMFGVIVLMFMDASFNVSMEPFRALVADKLDKSQDTLGFSVQTVLIGIGAALGSFMPSVLKDYFNVSNVAKLGQVPDNLVYSFYIGAAFFIGTILWTILTTKEYSPKEMKTLGIAHDETEKKLGLMEGISKMPKAMKELGLVQFFSWAALFLMWVYTSSAVATHVFGVSIEDKSSAEFQNAGDLVGKLFAVYNLISAGFAFFIPAIAKKFGKKHTHAIALLLGGLGLISIYFITNPIYLYISMIGVGIAWASILAMPYAILASHIPARSMGMYMGIFNFFITLPQIFNGFVGNIIYKNIFYGQPIFMLILAGVLLIIGAFASTRLND